MSEEEKIAYDDMCRTGTDLAEAINEGRAIVNALCKYDRACEELKAREDRELDKYKIPTRVYQFFWYLEARAIQRIRNLYPELENDGTPLLEEVILQSSEDASPDFCLHHQRRWPLLSYRPRGDLHLAT